MTWAIGVDIGGTFTDCVGIDPEGTLYYAKAISTQDTDVSAGVLVALDELAREAGQSTSELLGQGIVQKGLSSIQRARYSTVTPGRQRCSASR